MKVQKISIFLALAVASIANIHSSTLCFVNALPRTQKIDFLYKGEKIRPYPFEEGGTTLCLQVPAGPLAFTVVDPERGPVPLIANPESGKHKTAVVFEKAEIDTETGEISKKHSVLHVPQVGPPTGKTATFRVAYVGGTAPLSVTIGAETFKLEPDTFSAVKTAPLFHEVRTSETTEPWQMGFEEPSVYVLVIFRGNDSKLKQTVAYESIY
jgi:hypothetical protein